jgi:hypothetical protein
MLIATLRGGYFFALKEADTTSICSGRGSRGTERGTSHYGDKPLGANKKPSTVARFFVCPLQRKQCG